MAARRSTEPKPGETPVEESPVVTTSDLTKPAVEAPKGSTVVVSPAGYESTVPDSILDSLLDSGYTKK